MDAVLLSDICIIRHGVILRLKAVAVYVAIFPIRQ